MAGYANSDKYVIIDKIHNLVCQKSDRMRSANRTFWQKRENTMEKVKGLQGYLQDDKSLCKKVTYEQYMSKELTSHNRDYKIEDAYKAYRKVMEQKK